MKSKHLFVFAAFCAAAFSAFAVVPGEVSTVTLALTTVRTNEITNTDSSYVSSTVTGKYTNAMFLKDLFDEGSLTGATSITGWKLVIVNTTPLVTDNNPTFVFYAVNGTQKVKIAPSRFTFIAGAGANAEANKSILSGGNVVSFTASFTSIVSITGTQPEGAGTSQITLQGVAAGSQKSLTVTVASAMGGPSQTNAYNVIGAVKVTAMSGGVTFSDDTKFPVVVGGSMSFSAFVPTDISNYP